MMSDRISEILRRRNKQREALNRFSQYRPPYDIFLEIIYHAHELFKFVWENTRDYKLRSEAKKYLVIKSVTAMENYFKVMAQIFISLDTELDLIPKEFKESRLYGNASRLLRKAQEDLTIDECVVLWQNFQNPDKINNFFSKLLNVDFKREIAEIRVEVKEREPYVLKEAYPQFWEKIDNLVNLRNTIIHYGIIPAQFKKLSKNSLYEMLDNLIAFVTSVEIYLSKILSNALDSDCENKN